VTDLVIRPLDTGETALFESLSDPGLVGRAILGHTYGSRVATGECRPEWSWVALRDGTVVARAAWYGEPGDDAPFALDWLDFTDADAAIQLLRTAPLRTDYCLSVPPGWLADPDLRQAAQARIDVATAAGLEFLVERYVYCWTTDCGLPERPERLVYRPEPDDDVVLDVFRRVHHGSLDAHARRATAESDLDAAARADLDILHLLHGARDWWRLAYTRDGDLVGLTIPSLNQVTPTVAYVGVVPEHRGNGYAYDLLVEATHHLVDEGAGQIIAGTDTTNTPMAAAFAKAGYPIVRHRIDLV
jgi:RimJ/RimL family protein N-acetyltransferase